MERFTTNKDVQEMGMYELAHNCCYYKEGNARYRDFEMDMDTRDFARNLMTTLTNEDMPLDDELFDEEIMENLMNDPFSNVKGLIALFYRNLWAMAELREKLKEYEDAEEDGLLLRLPCRVGDTLYMPWEYDERMGVAVMAVYKICINEHGFFVETDLDSDDDGFLEEYNYGEFSFSDFGKTVFLTKAEAEQALAKMKEV